MSIMAQETNGIYLSGLFAVGVFPIARKVHLSRGTAHVLLAEGLKFNPQLFSGSRAGKQLLKTRESHSPLDNRCGGGQIV